MRNPVITAGAEAPEEAGIVGSESYTEEVANRVEQQLASYFDRRGRPRTNENSLITAADLGREWGESEARAEAALKLLRRRHAWKNGMPPPGDG